MEIKHPEDEESLIKLTCEPKRGAIEEFDFQASFNPDTFFGVKSDNIKIVANLKDSVLELPLEDFKVKFGIEYGEMNEYKPN